MNCVWSLCLPLLFAEFSVSTDLQACLKQDSISCLQIQIYRHIKNLSEEEKLEVFPGLELARAADKGKSIKQKQAEEEFEKAGDVESRQQALETYLMATGEQLWRDTALSWNVVKIASALIQAPYNVTFPEGRGKAIKKPAKVVKKNMLLFLTALKLKLAILSSVGLVVITAIAKKAILAALISLVLIGVIEAKDLASPKTTMQNTPIMPYQPPLAEWEPVYEGARVFQDKNRKH